ncbi:MAG: hypothetical protein JXA21_08590 [Anaerolineae bacterium]|nr:hypothetical protein [Anaerolineae bacterium]
MRIIADDSRIQKRARIGERAPFIGFIVIIAATALLISRRPEWLWLSTILVSIGFIITLIGGYLGERYVGALAHYKKVPEALKGLDNQYTLLMYKTPLPFVLIGPESVTVITVKSHGGNISYHKGKWHHHEKFGLWRRMAGQESLGQAHKMAEAEAEEMQYYLKKRLPLNVEVPVRPSLLFIHPNVTLDATESPVPALRIPQMRRWIRKEEQPKLSADTRTQLFEALGLEE